MFHKELQSLIVGNGANEGTGTSSDEGMPEAFGALVRRVLPTATNETIAEIQSFYDFVETPEKLAWNWTMDIVFSCNAANIAAAYKDTSRRYLFSVPPATHGLDLTYAFYINEETTPANNAEGAKMFQRNLLEFLHGGETDWSIYGPDMRVINVTLDGFNSIAFPSELDARCKMVNRVTGDPANGA